MSDKNQLSSSYLYLNILNKTTYYDGVKYFNWDLLENSLVSNTSASSSSSIFPIIGMRLFAFKLPYSRFETTLFYDKFTVLIQEFASQAFIGKNNKRHHFILTPTIYNTPIVNQYFMNLEPIGNGYFWFDFTISVPASLTLSVSDPFNIINLPGNTLRCGFRFTNPLQVLVQTDGYITGDRVIISNFTALSSVTYPIITTIMDANGYLITVTSPNYFTIPIDGTSLLATGSTYITIVATVRNLQYDVNICLELISVNSKKQNIENLLTFVPKIKKAYLTLDTRYAQLTSDTHFTWFFNTHPNSSTRELITYPRKIKNIISMKLFPFTISEDRTNALNRISILIDEFSSQSFENSNGDRFHFISNLISVPDPANQYLTRNRLLFKEASANSIFSFNDPIAQLNKLTISFRNPFNLIHFNHMFSTGAFNTDPAYEQWPTPSAIYDPTLIFIPNPVYDAPYAIPEPIYISSFTTSLPIADKIPIDFLNNEDAGYKWLNATGVYGERIDLIGLFITTLDTITIPRPTGMLSTFQVYYGRSRIMLNLELTYLE